MRGDTVILKAERIEGFRRKHGYGKRELCKCLSINAGTGLKILTRKAVSLTTARKVARAMRTGVSQLIESWEGEGTSETERPNDTGNSHDDTQ